VKKLENTATSWTICQECKGQGKKSRRINKKVRLQYQQSNSLKIKWRKPSPIRPKAHLDSCSNCSGSGLIPAKSSHKGIQKTIHILLLLAVLVEALAVVWHRGICLRYMSDSSLRPRSQGYGLTLQQASKGLKDWVFFHLKTEWFQQDI
jgi:hypothetical protein